MNVKKFVFTVGAAVFMSLACVFTAEAKDVVDNELSLILDECGKDGGVKVAADVGGNIPLSLIGESMAMFNEQRSQE